MTEKDLYELGEQPPLGYIPKQMHAQVIRQDRFGEPMKAFQREVIGVDEIGPHDALVYVMAAGVNYNNVWASLGMAGMEQSKPAEEAQPLARAASAGAEEDLETGMAHLSAAVESGIRKENRPAAPVAAEPKEEEEGC